MTLVPLLEVDDLHVHFFTEDGVVKAVDGVGFTLKPGQTLGIAGESGSGKSVTALSIMRLVPEPPGKIVGGDIRFKGDSVLAMGDKEQRMLRGDRISMVFQDPSASLNPVYRIGRQVAEPLRVHKSMTRKEAWAAAVELLRRVGIPGAAERARAYPHELSGGMRQRAVIAMALACEPDVLIADEPTTALDVTVQAQILELIRETQQKTRVAVLLVSNDLGVLADVGHEILVMYAGRVVERGPASEIFYDPLHPYTWGLQDSVPRQDEEGKSSVSPIKGQPPSLIDLPSGCAFQPRCPYSKPECQRKGGSLVEVDPGHWSACLFSGEEAFVGQHENPVGRGTGRSGMVE